MHLRLFISTIFATFAILTNAMAIDNCSYEFTGTDGKTYCGTCNDGYGLYNEQTNYWWSSGLNGAGTKCELKCKRAEHCNGSDVIEQGNNVTCQYYRLNETRYTNYARCADPEASGYSMVYAKAWCESQKDCFCDAHYYGNPTSTAAGKCTKCPTFSDGADPVYGTSATTIQMSGRTAKTGTTSVTGCYIPVNTYYTKKGQFKITSDCYYSN